MAGYDPTFLRELVPLPDFSPTIAGDVLRNAILRDDVYADYVNYTVAMHGPYRTPLFAALNVDQKQYRQTTRASHWKLDSRIGPDYQIDNAYYRSNPWDRGHLARRATAGWGDTPKAAQRAADETFYYSNATLQHANVNQDEWLALEDWVFDIDLDRDDRFSSFSGPIFGDYMRTIRPDGRPAAFIPTGFFKVVFFMNKQDKLEVRAFIVPQDTGSMADKRGRMIFDHQIYQVSVAEIEELTGLDFPEVLPDCNPLFYFPSESARTANVHELPERREVNVPEDIVRDNESPREVSFADDAVDVFIAAAMVNPAGSEREGEWVSIINLEPGDVSVEGWRLLDDKQRQATLTGTIGPGEAVRVQPLSPVQLANSRAGFIQLIDDKDRQIDRVPYSEEQARREGRPVVFAYREIDYDRGLDDTEQV